MLTRLYVENFKRLGAVDIELGQTVVFIGPNNSGKTSALQALALWETGLRTWLAKRGDAEGTAKKRPGVTLNRKDLIALTTPSANLLWRDQHVRDVERDEQGKPKTRNVLIRITVEGVSQGQPWLCGLEFDYANPESLYCRPKMMGNGERMAIPAAAKDVRVAFLPPMSGLASVEPKLEPGRINVLIGEGRTAEVLRNLCWRLHETPEVWAALARHIESLFGVRLQSPVHLAARGEITMAYVERGTELDLSSAGRGLQQTLLLLAYLYAHPRTALLLDEPDAHLEILRQREIYQRINDIARDQGGQIIAASHSEIILNEAAGRDAVVAFVGSPHRLNPSDRGHQLLKSLQTIGFDQYYLAEETGWVLYLEGPTDLAILRAFAQRLEHPALPYLAHPFVHYVATNLPKLPREHFHGLREAKPDLVGLALFDRLGVPLEDSRGLTELMWQRREIENYLCQKETLLAYARFSEGEDLFALAEAERRVEAMGKCMAHLSDALSILDKPSPWSPDSKATDDFLNPLFNRFFQELGLPAHTLRKSGYHELVAYVPVELIDPEVNQKLDSIMAIAKNATPRKA